MVTLEIIDKQGIMMWKVEKTYKNNEIKSAKDDDIDCIHCLNRSMATVSVEANKFLFYVQLVILKSVPGSALCKGVKDFSAVQLLYMQPQLQANK